MRWKSGELEGRRRRPPIFLCLSHSLVVLPTALAALPGEGAKSASLFAYSGSSGLCCHLRAESFANRLGSRNVWFF